MQPVSNVHAHDGVLLRRQRAWGEARDATRGRGRETPRERIGSSRSEPALKSPRDARDGARAAAADAAPAPPLPPSPAVGVLERHTAAELTAPPLQVLPQI